MLRPPELPVTDDAATEAFVAQLAESRHRIYAFIAKQLVDPADAEDVFQKTSVVLWRKMHSFDASRSFFSWACGIALNEVRNFVRIKKRSRLYFDAELLEVMAEESRQEDELSAARLSALRACTAPLSERQRTVLQRCYAGDESIADVSASMGRSRDALYKLLARLREKLLACIRLRLAREGVG